MLCSGLIVTWASRVVILGSGVSGSEELGLDRFSLLCICLELCQDAGPDGLTFKGRVKGCDALRLTGSLWPDAMAAECRAGAELMRCIVLSVGRGWILELRFPVESLVVQVEAEGRSPTKDWGRSPASEMLGGGSILESCFCFFSIREGMLCLELRARPWGAI